MLPKANRYMYQSGKEKVETLVFKVFWNRKIELEFFRNRAISYLHLAIAFKCNQVSSVLEQAV